MLLKAWPWSLTSEFMQPMKQSAILIQTEGNSNPIPVF